MEGVLEQLSVSAYAVSGLLHLNEHLWPAMTEQGEINTASPYAVLRCNGGRIVGIPSKLMEERENHPRTYGQLVGEPAIAQQAACGFDSVSQGHRSQAGDG